MRRVAQCNGPSCGAEILWCRTQAGKNMCLDAEPTPDGDWMIEGEDEPKPLAVKLPPHAEHYTGPRYTSHWGTCPDRDRFKKARKP